MSRYAVLSSLGLRRFSIVFLFLGAACSKGTEDIIGEGPVVPASTTEIPLEASAITRKYLLHIPPISEARLKRERRPLLLVLHGSAGVAETVRRQSGMDSLADAGRFLVAYPEGLGGDHSDWNAGDCCGYPHAAGVDDIAFLRAVIADISVRTAIDSRRVYIAGFSDGARMAYRAACEMSTQVAAVAAVAGSLSLSDCAPVRLVPVIAFHGTADKSVPYDDSAHTAIPTSVPQSAATLPPTTRFWIGTNRCRAVGHHNSPRVVQTSGAGCLRDVTLYTLANGTHEWPDSMHGSALTASPLIVHFFSAHPAP